MACPVSSLIDLAVKKLYQYVDAQVADVRAFRAIVTGQSSGMVQIRRIHAASGETALRARVIGFNLATNDEVLCLPMPDGIPVVVGRLQRATPSAAFAVPVPLSVSSASAAIYAGTGSPEGAVTAAVGSIYQRTDGGTDTAVYRKESGSGNTGWVAIAQPSTVWVPHIRQAFSDTAVNNSSTSSWLDVVSLTTTLPSGTWTAEVSAWGRIGHDSDGNIDLRVVIDGTNGTTYTRSGPSSGAYPGGAMSSKSSVSSGSRTAKLQIKSGSSGTSTMTNAFLHFNAYRTA